VQIGETTDGEVQHIGGERIRMSSMPHVDARR
jgi:hypothetical protein